MVLVIGVGRFVRAVGWRLTFGLVWLGLLGGKG